MVCNNRYSTSCVTLVFILLGLGYGTLSVQAEILMWNWTADESQVKNGPNSMDPLVVTPQARGSCVMTRPPMR